MRELQPGDICIVTGDKAHFGHRFEQGAVVELRYFREFSQGPGWSAQRVGGIEPTQDYYRGDDYWDVAVADLVLAEPLEEEVEQAIRSITEVLRRNP